MNVPLCVSALMLWASLPGLSQVCPKRSAAGSDIQSEVQTLNGRLVFHNGLRRWFELKLDQPQCGQRSVELVLGDGDWTRLEVLRGCRVRSSGRIDFSSTGYYSLDTYQFVEALQALGRCERKSRFPDFSGAEPEKRILSYRVNMHIDYTAGDHPPVFHVSSSGKELKPWQVYASYDFTGGFVLYGHCGRGFVIGRTFGTREAKPMHLEEPGTPEDMAAFDPESAAAAGVKKLNLGYTCKRVAP